MYIRLKNKKIKSTSQTDCSIFTLPTGLGLENTEGMVLLENYYILLIFHSQLLFGLANLYTGIRNADHGGTQGQEVVLCRKCGADVLDSHYLFSKLSPGARSKKQNLFGKQNVTVQSLVNPFGVKFDIITAEKARCDNVGYRQKADSWFPGYTWRLCACPQCGQHLGWTFENIEKSTDQKDYVQTFHGLILANVLGENFTDSLMMMPAYTM